MIVQHYGHHHHNDDQQRRFRSRNAFLSVPGLANSNGEADTRLASHRKERHDSTPLIRKSLE